jgi:DNA-binding NtrC family response regulator
MSEHPRIALIDDDRDWAEALAEYLCTKGFAIQIRGDGVSGLALLEQDSIPVAVVDFDMPGLDGLELLERLRQRRPDVAVLLVSGEEDPDLAGRAVAAGAHAFVPKTASPPLLLEAVRQALRAVERRQKPWNRLLAGPKPTARVSGRD